MAAYFQVLRRREIYVDERTFEFQPGDDIRLFFSYRHTPALVRTLLAQHGFQVDEQWITKSQEEGIFLARREA